MSQTPRSDKAQLKPEILAPAGNRLAFLAAVGAGADAVYCGLKHFSARMEAKNFTLNELAGLTRLAHDRGIKVYVALNAALKPEDLKQAGALLQQLQESVAPDALIIQDLGLIELARQTGFSGEIHLSTLTNFSSGSALKQIQSFPQVSRIVLPRELSIDEIKSMAADCPKLVGLEVFVHGALCYGVSGRCYWSSYMGGKSSLRGRCVQPCRRQYTHNRQSQRYFSCHDLSLDVLVNTMLNEPKVKAWKIEGRKKGPHYVYYTVLAYRILRDIDDQPESRAQVKKTAVALLEQALGRPGTHYHFLPQKSQKAVDIKFQTGSGLFVGRVQGTAKRPFLVPRIDLLRGDVLRLGYEDEKWHAVQRVGRGVPEKGRYTLSSPTKRPPAKGTPVFLTDRRETFLVDILQGLERELDISEKPEAVMPLFRPQLPDSVKQKPMPREIYVYRHFSKRSPAGRIGLWLTKDVIVKTPAALIPQIWWWLPPVVWPDEEDAVVDVVKTARHSGARHFILNTPWQTGLMGSRKNLNLWAGPFCNLSNPLALAVAADFGFSGAIISPELGGADLLALPRQSPIPLGVVIDGNWPLCISRTVSESIEEDQPFTSPKGEKAWVHRYEQNYWVYPNWKLDLKIKMAELRRAGYRVFIHLVEPVPGNIELKKRPGLWNWDVGLK